MPLQSYATPRQWAQLALERLTAVVDEFFPVESVPDALLQQRFFHNAFAASRRGIYLQSDADFAQLTEFVAAENPQGLIILKSLFEKKGFFWFMDEGGPSCNALTLLKNHQKT